MAFRQFHIESRGFRRFPIRRRCIGRQGPRCFGGRRPGLQPRIRTGLGSVGLGRLSEILRGNSTVIRRFDRQNLRSTLPGRTTVERVGRRFGIVRSVNPITGFVQHIAIRSLTAWRTVLDRRLCASVSLL